MKIVIVEWVDICKNVNDNEFDDRDKIEDKLARIKTVGWLYKETKKTILLMQESWNGTVRDWIVIPKCNIKNIKVIYKDD